MQQEQQRINRILTTILSEVDRRIYNLIKEQPYTKKDLNRRTKLPTNLLDKILKELSSYNLVKSIKKPQSKNMNVWVLYSHVEEESNILHEQDNQDLMSFIRNKQFESITTSDLQKDAVKKGIKVDELGKILQIMSMRGEIYLLNNEKVIKRQFETLPIPCMQCQLRKICTPEGVISPSTCPYMLNW